jgi:hypothetical protein
VLKINPLEKEMNYFAPVPSYIVIVSAKCEEATGMLQNGVSLQLF